MRYCHRNRKRHVLTSLRDGAHAFFFSCSLRQFSLATRQSSGGVRWPRLTPLFSRQPSHVSLPRTIFPAKVPHFPPCHRAVFNIDHIFLRIISPVYGQFSTISAKQSHDTSSSIPAQFCNSEFSTFFTDFPTVSTVEKLKTLFKDINLLHLQL